MNDNKRREIINSWHECADVYAILINRYQVFTDMTIGLVRFVEKYRIENDEDIRVIDLAAGTGLISKLLIQYLHIAPSSLYLVEPAENMCILARNSIETAHLYQIAAEDCLSIPDLPRDYFDFILCNASMHLMSENDIYPIVLKLLKPKTGFFLYTLWYHAFDETKNYDSNERIETYFDEALNYFKYPNYFSAKHRELSTANHTIRSRKYLEETAHKYGLKMESCVICMHQVPLSFDFEFMLMKPSWLIEHLKNYEWTQNLDVYFMKEQIIDKVRELIKDEFIEKPVVQVALSRL